MQEMELKKIAVIGPRGNVGSAVITELLKHDTRFTITAITRPGTTYDQHADSPNPITHKSADFASLDSLTAAFADQDALINCVPGCATHYEPSKLIVDAALAAGVKFFFANEFVGDITRPQFLRLPEAIVGSKPRIRSYLNDLAKDGKIQWSSLNGGPFFDMWVAKGPAGFHIPNRQARIYGTGLAPLHWTPLPSIAFAVVAILLNPTPYANRAVHIAPIPNLTQLAILSALEAHFNEKFNVEYIDVALINKNALIALERGEAGKAMKGLTVSNQFFEGDRGNDLSGLVENEGLGIREISVEEAVRDAVERWGVDGVVEGMFKVEACEV